GSSAPDDALSDMARTPGQGWAAPVRRGAPGSGAEGSAQRRRAYLTTTLADLISSSLSVTPCFCAALGLTCSSNVLLTCEAILPGASPLRMRTTTLPVWRPRS